MPGKHVQGDAEKPCRRCRNNPSVLVVRTEPLCRDCFTRYVQTKAIKRMETFRVRYSAPDQQRKILLPLSFGVSSITLLSILDTHLKTQQTKTGRTGFSLLVLFVDTSAIDISSPNPDLLSRLKDFYPDHEYTSIPIQDLVSNIQSPDPLFDLVPDLASSESSNLNRFTKLINSLTTATAREDVLTTLRTRLIVSHAKLHSCEAILWADSTTTLASKTLSETAKGRGFSLPWQISDGDSPFGLSFNYPLRDVLKKELTSYVEICEPEVKQFVYEEERRKGDVNMSSKSTTIDDLMRGYFEGVEEGFPSIVANVVRTVGKLEAGGGAEAAKEKAMEEPRCGLCNMPVEGGRFGIHGWGGDQQDGLVGEEGEGRKGLCYGCTRSMPRMRTTANGA